MEINSTVYKYEKRYTKEVFIYLCMYKYPMLNFLVFLNSHQNDIKWCCLILKIIYR